MAYADQKMSAARVWALVIVALLHVFIGYAFISGLAYKYVKQVTEDTETFDVEEPPPPPEEIPPPPPPPEDAAPPPPASPPLVTPPPQVVVPVQTPPMQTTTTIPPRIDFSTVASPRPEPVGRPEPAPVPPPPTISKAAAARGNPGEWVTADDYPASALRAEEQGVSGITFDINAAGRIENCRVSSSSGSSALDRAACSLVTRRGRYSPALNAAGQPVPGGSKTLRFTWRLPED